MRRVLKKPGKLRRKVKGLGSQREREIHREVTSKILHGEETRGVLRG